MKTALYKFKIVTLLIITGLIPLQCYAVKAGENAPDFSIQQLGDGDDISLKHFQGKVVYLDFWASWCPPCLKSFPFMEEIKTRYEKQGLIVLAVSLDEKVDDAKAFLHETPASFLVGHNNNSDIADQYNVQAMPTTYLIGRNGKIHYVHRGFKTSHKEKLNKLIKDML